GDGDPRVRLQLALSLGEWDLPAAGVALANLASEQKPTAPSFAPAVLSSAPRHLKPLVESLAAKKGRFPMAIGAGLLRMAVMQSDNDRATSLLAAVMERHGQEYSAEQLNAYFDCRDLMKSRGLRFEK